MSRIYLFLFMLMSASGFSQERGDTLWPRAKYMLGAKFGVANSNYQFINTDYTGQNLFFYENRFRSVMGIFAGINLNKRLSLNGEINFQDLGWNRFDTAQTAEHPMGTETQYHFKYAGLQIEADYNFYQKRRWSIGGVIGGGFSFLVNSSAKTTDNGRTYLNAAPSLKPNKSVVWLMLGVTNDFQLGKNWGVGLTISGIQLLTKVEPVITNKVGMNGAASISCYFTFN